MTHQEDQMDIRRREFFNDHADGWMDTFYRNSETGVFDRYYYEFARLFDLAGLAEGDSVLDCGCGCGVLVPHILEHIGENGRLLEVDYAERMIEVNRQLHPDHRVDFMVSSVDNIDRPDEAFNAVICFSCFPHFQDKAGTLSHLNRLMKPGGKLTIGHFGSSHEINDRHHKHECVMHDQLPNEADIRTMVTAAGFRVDTFIDESGFYCLTAKKM